MDAERRERELVARFRLRMARAASSIALIAIVAVGFHLLMEPRGPLELWALLAAGAVVSVAIRRRSGPGARPLPLWAFFVWTAAVLAFDTAVVYLDGHPATDIYLVYLLVVLFAAATLPAWGAAGALVTAVVAYVAVVLVLDSDIRQPELVMRAATFTVVGLLGGYLAREQQREIAARVRKERDLGRVLDRAISAQEGERARIARELHDGPVQELSSVSMRLGLVEETARDEDVARQRVAEARAELRRTLGELRRVISDLRPSALDDLGLVPALHDLATARCDAAGVQLRWTVSGDARRIAPSVETAVFRIVQEAVNNVARHAHARCASVSIAFEDGHLCAQVQDDGIGFDAERVHRSRDGVGVGLLGMQERAALVGGTLEIGPSAPFGTVVRARVPTAGIADG